MCVSTVSSLIIPGLLYYYVYFEFFHPPHTVTNGVTTTTNSPVNGILLLNMHSSTASNTTTTNNNNNSNNNMNNNKNVTAVEYSDEELSESEGEQRTVRNNRNSDNNSNSNSNSNSDSDSDSSTSAAASNQPSAANVTDNIAMEWELKPLRTVCGYVDMRRYYCVVYGFGIYAFNNPCNTSPSSEQEEGLEDEVGSSESSRVALQNDLMHTNQDTFQHAMILTPYDLMELVYAFLHM